MKGTAVCLISALALSGMVGARAADTAKASIMRVFTETVAPPDQSAFEAGIKSFEKCLAEHGYKFSWIGWLHETGDTYQYSFVSAPAPWATLDAMQTQGSACVASWRNDVNPHLKGESSALLEVKPELSHMGKDMGATAALMEVTVFKLKPGHEAHEAFTAAIKKVAAAADKSGWSSHYTVVQVMDADHGAPDFLLASYSSNWTDFGKDADPPVWKMVEGVYGKTDAAALRKSLNDAVQEVSSHLDSRSAELSYTAPGG